MAFRAVQELGENDRGDGQCPRPGLVEAHFDRLGTAPQHVAADVGVQHVVHQKSSRSSGTGLSRWMRKSAGSRTAWLRPFMKSLAVWAIGHPRDRYRGYIPWRVERQARQSCEQSG